MLEDEEYPSDSDQSDDDYKPDDGNCTEPSEIDSDGEPENDAVDESVATKLKGRKRKSIEVRNGSKNKRSKLSEEFEKKTSEKTAENIGDDNEEEDSKARVDALWADFLNGTDTGTSTTPTSTSTSLKSTPSTKSVERSKCEDKPVAKQEKTPTPNATTVKEIFEFAGEKIEVEKEIKTDDKKDDSKVTTAGSNTLASRARSGGLNSVLGQLGKKNKLSVLEKTKLDWTGFKKNEGIEEELHGHNKGRDGYLERQDFLERTDFRRFEIEKSLRQVTRKK